MNAKQEAKGSIVISLIFVILISFLSIALLSFTIAHTRIVSARAKKITETGEMTRDLIYHLHDFREIIFTENIQDFDSPETDYFNNTFFPDKVIDSRHLIAHSFEHIDFPGQDFKKTSVTAAMEVSSNSGKNNYRLNSEVTIDVLSGKIPLTVFPFFLNRGAAIPAETFLEENNIVNKSGKNMIVEDIETGLDFSRFLLDALKISGTVLSWREIREKVGLELSDEPIQEGIYVQVEEGTGIVVSVFIQGDVERLIFSVHSPDQLQGIRLIKETQPYEVRYKPGEPYFICWNPSIESDSLFEEKVIVNGSVWSVEQEGDAAFTASSDIVLYVSGKVDIRSNLETDIDQFNLRGLELSNFTLACGKEELFEQSGGAGPEVMVNTEAKTDLRASIITSGKFTNKSSQLNLSGSLFCKDLENNGKMEITHAAVKSTIMEGNYFHTVDFKTIDRFLIGVIEEVSDEN